ncbi:MAG: DEAD/DEAH box helicase [Ignisphaera sp.]|uniref:DNA 3'-5' helicase n=1 Tax=Ignisphaera aggregans TaxID=334771 RepID=A0A7C4JKH2_9CREN
MIKNIVFYVDEWLEREDFELFLKFSKYLGREEGKSKFLFDVGKLEKAIKNKEVEPGEVIDMLTSYDVEFENASIDDIKKVIESLMPKVTVRVQDNEILLIPSVFLRDKIKDLIEKKMIKYDPHQKAFKLVKPMYLFEVIDILRNRDIIVRNETNIDERAPLPLKIKFLGKLRDYQLEALDAWRKNGFKGVIALPTGTGKTVIAVAALAELNVRTLVVTYTKEQMFQWGEKIASFTDVPKGLIGYFYSSEKRVLPITIVTYQSAYRYIDMLAPYFSFIIVDEVHHLPADKFRYIAENMFARYRLGLSATVIREDGRHVELFPLMGGIVYSKAMAELAEKGYIAPFTVETVKVSLTAEEKKRYKELLEKYKKLVGGRTFEEVLEEAKRGNPRALEAVKIRTELRMLVHNAQEKLKAVEQIVAKELEQGSRILVFTQYVEQAKQIAERLNTYYIVGELDESTRRRRLEAFKHGAAKVLVLTTVGDEGIDVPDANVGVIVAGTSSKRQFIQRLGRLLRPIPGKQAKLYEIIVKGTFEEAESRKRKEALRIMFQDLLVDLSLDLDKIR